jgi:hypothetical protein
MPAALKPFFVKLTPQDRARLDRLAADSGAAAGHPVSLADVVRQLVRDASRKGVPLRIRVEDGL